MTLAGGVEQGGPLVQLVLLVHVNTVRLQHAQRRGRAAETSNDMLREQALGVGLDRRTVSKDALDDGFGAVLTGQIERDVVGCRARVDVSATLEHGLDARGLVANDGMDQWRKVVEILGVHCVRGGGDEGVDHAPTTVHAGVVQWDATVDVGGAHVGGLSECGVEHVHGPGNGGVVQTVALVDGVGVVEVDQTRFIHDGAGGRGRSGDGVEEDTTHALDGFVVRGGRARRRPFADNWHIAGVDSMDDLRLHFAVIRTDGGCTACQFDGRCV